MKFIGPSHQIKFEYNGHKYIICLGAAKKESDISIKIAKYTPPYEKFLGISANVAVKELIKASKKLQNGFFKLKLVKPVFSLEDEDMAFNKYFLPFRADIDEAIVQIPAYEKLMSVIDWQDQSVR